MNRKGLAIGILMVWTVSFGWLLQRELLQADDPLLPDQPLNVSPGATYYRLSLGNVQVGFRTTSVDTVADTVRVLDLTLLNLPVAGRGLRIEARSAANLSRGLALRTFQSSLREPEGRLDVTGRIDGDSALLLAMVTPVSAQNAEMPIRDAIVLPSLLPMRLAFGRRIAIGQTDTMTVFDPLLLDRRTVRLRVTAESTFVVPDSADQPEGQLEWFPARWDTVHAWHVVVEDDQYPFEAWIDDLGQFVSVRTPVGFDMERTAYEIAYENFLRGDSIPVLNRPRQNAIEHTTARAPGLGPRVQELRVRLRGVDVARMALASRQQTLVGDTLMVRAADPNDLRPQWRLPNRDGTMRRFREASPLIPSADQRVQAQARQIVGATRNPTRAIESLVDWMGAEIDVSESTGSLNAIDVLSTRSGDANGHTTLFVAMARAVEVPARPVSGLVLIDGGFRYHAWAEVFLRDWVPVDPTFGQWPADAGRVRLLVGGLARHIELLGVVGNLSLEVLEVRSE